jgi:hypothetical protein
MDFTATTSFRSLVSSPNRHNSGQGAMQVHRIGPFGDILGPKLLQHKKTVLGDSNGGIYT